MDGWCLSCKNQLGELLFGVFKDGLVAIRQGQQRDLGPDHKACLIAQVIGQVGVLVVGQAHRVGPHPAEQLDVLPLLCL